MPSKVLVIGGGQAGINITTALREFGYSGQITLAGEEDELPYQRPPLSKGLLAGTESPGALALRNREYFEHQRIDLLTGERVIRLEWLTPDGGGVATTQSGRDLGFDRLAFTLGGTPRLLPTFPVGPGVHYLRTLADSCRLAEQLGQARSVVIVGGGFIGLEVAAVARQGGCAVTVLEASSQLMGRVVSPAVSEMCRRYHECQGTHVVLDAVVERPLYDSGVLVGVRDSSGCDWEADLVLVAVGMEPRTDLAESAGLDVAGGIVVDRYARTSRRGVVAAGDCTIVRAESSIPAIRLESVPNALAQGQAAAASLLDLPTQERTATPWFWSNQGKLRLQMVGLPAVDDDVTEVRFDDDPSRLSLLFHRQGRLVGGQFLNSPADFMKARRALSS